MDMRQWGQQFLKPEELLKHGPLKEQIAVVKPPADDDKYPKPTLVFESGKMVKVNKQSVGALMAEFGTDSIEWIGRFVECRHGSALIDNTTRDFVIVEPIDVIMPDTSEPATRRKIDPSAAKADMDDEIPF